jgi:hypothetical protein
MMGTIVEGMVVGKRRWTERLHSLLVDAEVAPFQAGSPNSRSVSMAN